MKELDDPIIQDILKNRQEMTDVSAHDEAERLRRLCSLIKDSKPYKLRKVQQANELWKIESQSDELSNPLYPSKEFESEKSVTFSEHIIIHEYEQVELQESKPSLQERMKSFLKRFFKNHRK